MIAKPDISLALMVRQNEARHGEVPAYIDGERSLTHRALAERARMLSGALYRTAGCRHQDRVAILSRNSIEYGVFYAACQLSGFIATTVNFRLAAPEIAATLSDSTPTVLLFENVFTEAVSRMRDLTPLTLLYVCIGGEGPEWAMDYDTFCESGAGVVLPFEGRGEDIAALIYTSGSTGKPKGCIIGQREFARLSQLLAGGMGIVERDRVALPMPLFHIGAKSLQGALHWGGATVVIMREFRPAAYLASVQEFRITKGHLAPTMIQMLLEVPDLARYDLSSLGLIMYSAAAMPVAVLRRAMATFGPIFQNSYGMTEGAAAMLDTGQHQPDGDAKALRRLTSVGIPYPGVQAAIMGEDDVEMAAGETGEICLRSDCMFRGYWNNSAATIQTMRNGWYHTGDVGKMDEDGFIYLQDRKKDMIISGGENIYSREVEDALLAHPGVGEVAVIGIPDEKWGELVCAVVVTRANAVLSSEDLIAHCRTMIASYKKPSRIVYVDELPKLPTGKINKLALRATYGMAAP